MAKHGLPVSEGLKGEVRGAQSLLLYEGDYQRLPADSIKLRCERWFDFEFWKKKILRQQSQTFNILRCPMTSLSWPPQTHSLEHYKVFQTTSTKFELRLFNAKKGNKSKVDDSKNQAAEKETEKTKIKKLDSKQ